MDVRVSTAPDLDKRTEDLAWVDFSYYASGCLQIQTMEGQLVPFALNEPQKILESIVAEIYGEGKPVRLVILKARREGVSTWTEGRFYWKTSTRFNRYAVCVTHEPDATDFLFKMTKRFHDNCPASFKPPTRYSNAKLLAFNTETGTGLDSAFRVGTADKKDFGSGQLIHYLHLSEVAKWPKHTEKDLLTSLLQCVPDDKGTEIIIESTAKGIGGEFYDRFFACRTKYYVVLMDGKPVLRKETNESASPDNAYASVFLPWYIFDKYQMDVPKEFKRTGAEEELVKLYGLTNHHLAWRRWAIENKCSGRVSTFKQEYPSNPIECFLSSGRPVFDNEKLLELIKVSKEPVIRYDCLMSTGQWIAKPDGGLKVWQEPAPGRSYIVSADVAEGLEHGDYSSADIIDHHTGKQVAHWHGHIDPDLYGRLLVHIARRYNNAWIGPERNNHGLAVVSAINNMDYQKLYAEMIEEPPARPRKRYGWLTSTATRPLIIDNLVALMREGTHGISEKETFVEMMSFKIQEDGKMEADEGMKDDRVMSIAIGQYLRKKLPLPAITTQIPLSNQGMGAGAVSAQKAPPVQAWT